MKIPTDSHAQPGKTQSSMIVAQHLTKCFGQLTAVDDVSVSVANGEIFGLIGANGAGKSTLVKMLTTLLTPTEGSASVAGFDTIRQPAEVRRHIGYVPQLLSADGDLTGRENMLLSTRLYATRSSERKRRIDDALSAMGLADAAGRLVKTYSGGMIRRLEIAQAMLHEPPVLFMDEPTVGLDPLARDAVWEHVRMLRRSFGTTMLVTTHYLEEADLLCDRIAIMQRGRFVAVGSPKELKSIVGPTATLDDVLVHLIGQTSEQEGGYGDVRRERRSAIAHG
jgi:ABC-2 type transport system ATP-binding protein